MIKMWGVMILRKVDITNGPVFKSVIAYAIPVILGALVQVAFNAADLMVVGQMGDAASIAAVGAVGPIVGLLVSSFVGLSAGVNAVLAIRIGKRENEKAKVVVSTSLIFAFVLGFAVTASCLGFAEPLLKASGCEDEYFAESMQYIKLYAIGIPALMLYNFAAAVIRTSGDTQRPFIYLVIAGIMNVALNFVLCLVLEQKAAAVALATTASQYTGAILSLVHLLKDKGICGFSFGCMRFSFRELKSILRIGIPCAFNSMLFSLSNVQMNAAINSYGVNATAGNAAAANLESIASSFTSGFGVAAVAFVGQNVGAGDKERVKKSIFSCVTAAFLVQLAVTLSVFLLRRYWLMLYLPNEPDAVAFAVSRMKHVLLLMPLSAFFNSLASSMQAFGYSFIPM